MFNPDRALKLPTDLSQELPPSVVDDLEARPEDLKRFLELPLSALKTLLVSTQEEAYGPTTVRWLLHTPPGKIVHCNCLVNAPPDAESMDSVLERFKGLYDVRMSMKLGARFDFVQVQEVGLMESTSERGSNLKVTTVPIQDGYVLVSQIPSQETRP